jgi:hypothetical protein
MRKDRGEGASDALNGVGNKFFDLVVGFRDVSAVHVLEKLLEGLKVEELSGTALYNHREWAVVVVDSGTTGETRC